VASATRSNSVRADRAEGGGSLIFGASPLISDILSIIDNTGEIVGARTLNRELQALGYAMSESSVSRQLTALDLEGLTVRHGQRGRTLSHSGRGTLLAMKTDQRRRMLFKDAFDVTRVEDLLELLEARVSVETGVAQIAAAHASEDGVTRLREILDHDTGKAADARASSIPGAERLSFHRALGQECGNRVMVALSESLFDTRLEALEEVHDLIALMSGTYDLAHDEHAKILDGIASHDSEVAGKAMTRHLTRLVIELKEFAKSTPPQSLDRLVSAIRT
jgi:DNA-binding FadR family transcriptional regulator